MVADIARAHEVDPRLLRRWLRKADLAIARGPALTGNTVPSVSAAPAFVPVTVTSSPMSLTDPISLEVTRGKTGLRMIVPIPQAERCFQVVQACLA